MDKVQLPQTQTVPCPKFFGLLTWVTLRNATGGTININQVGFDCREQYRYSLNAGQSRTDWVYLGRVLTFRLPNTKALLGVAEVKTINQTFTAVLPPTPTPQPTLTATPAPAATSTPQPTTVLVVPTTTPVPVATQTALPATVTAIAPTQTAVSATATATPLPPTPTAIPPIVNDSPELVSLKVVANPRGIGSWQGGFAVEANPRGIASWGGPTSDGYNRNQTAYKWLGADRANFYSAGDRAVVAVLDTGFQLDHPMLTNYWTTARYDFVDRDFDPTDTRDNIDNDGNRYVDEAYGHGTHVAGIIRIIAPNARIMPIRVLNADGDGNLANLIAGIDFAANNGANIINLSLGSTHDSVELQAAVRRAYDKGVLVIAAAGNLDFWVKQYPAAYSCAVAVTSYSQLDNLANALSANWLSAKWIDYALPGENIFSTFPNSGYATWSGTSMSTPVLAAMAALVNSRYPNASPKQIMTLINGTSDTIRLKLVLLSTTFDSIDITNLSSFAMLGDSFTFPYLVRSADAGYAMQFTDAYFSGQYASLLSVGGALSDCR